METARNSKRNIVRILLVTAFILLIPLVAMQFTDEVKWGVTDFAIIGALLIGAGLIYELVASWVKSARYRAALGIVFVVAVLLIWVELAVGIFGTPFAGS